MTGPFFAVIVAVLFGLSSPLAKTLIGSIDPWLLAGLLYLGSGIGMAFIQVIRAFGSKNPTQIKIAAKEIPWLAGLIFFGGESLDLLDRYGHERLAEWRQMRGLDTNVEIELQENTWVADHKSEILKHLPGTGPEIEQLLALLHLKLAKNSDDLSDRKLQAS
jgi:hypothetical protein